MAFKTYYNEPPIIEDYFYGEPKPMFEENHFLEKDHHGLMMEWGTHYCSIDPNFSKNFKALYNMADKRLFQNPYLNFTISDELLS